jgi:hypothetical protein
MHGQSLPVILAALFMILAPTPVNAAEPWSAIDSTFFLRAGAWSGNRQIDDADALGQGEIWARSKAGLGDAGVVRLDGWLRMQSHSGQRDIHSGGGEARHGRVRELYWQTGTDALEFRIGRQNIVWGRADGLNPTNNLTARDFTQLTPEDGDQYFGNDAIRMDLHGEAGQFTGIYFPKANSHVLPLAKTPGVTYRIVSPESQSQWAVKWQGSRENMDGSLSYFSGVDRMPDLSVSAIGAEGVSIAVENHRTRVIGADMSLSANGMVWRAEAARTRTDNAGPTDFSRKRDQFWLVAGAEKNFANALTLSVQLSYLKVYRFADPSLLGHPLLVQSAQRQAATSNQTAPEQFGLTWRAAKRARNDALLAELNGVAFPGNGMVRGRLSYAFNDEYVLTLGGDFYYGQPATFFGQLKQNRLVFVQLQRGW